MSTPDIDAPPVPKEALAFFRRKQLKVGFDYRDVWKAEHDTNFTVAKITELDVLEDLRKSIEDAIAQGQTFTQWRDNIRPILEAKGWWRTREVLDVDTGELARTKLGAPARLTTVYSTNMRTAYNAGQWDRIQRTKQFLPYILRSLGPSAVHRPQHVAWAGTLLPADDPWWPTHPCPGGYGCKCNNRQVGRVEYDKMVKDGVPTRGQPEVGTDGLPTGRRIQGRIDAITVAPADHIIAWKNTRTGKIEQIPEGIDPGFNYQPGEAGRQERLADAYEAKLDSVDPALASAVRNRITGK